MNLLSRLEACFNEGVGELYATRLQGGAPEPYYEAFNKAMGCSVIWYRDDYVRSALHELAHWSVAGQERRKQDDYGYWYAPDGRTESQQEAFFKVERLPQAVERWFCESLGVPFAVSLDNLDGSVCQSAVAAFELAVKRRYQSLLDGGVSERMQLVSQAIRMARDSHKKFISLAS